jgi:hypothetical protein
VILAISLSLAQGLMIKVLESCCDSARDSSGSLMGRIRREPGSPGIGQVPLEEEYSFQGLRISQSLDLMFGMKLIPDITSE